MSDSTSQPENESALSRLAESPVSRRRFMAAAGATGAMAALLAACGDDSGDMTTSGSSSTTSGGSQDAAIAQFGKGDVGILNYALTLEYLEAAFYADVIGSGLFKGADLELIRTFGKDEDAHVQALTATVKKLGGKPAPKPKTKFELPNAKAVLEQATDVENLGAAAYLGQAAHIESDEVLAAALSIHAVEGRHAAALATLTDQSFVPDGAFAKPADAQTVLDQVQSFIVS